MTESYFNQIIRHYKTKWENEPNVQFWDKGPIDKLNTDFRVLEFAPTKNRSMWTYATCCMSNDEDAYPIELHLFSVKQDQSLIELLFAIAYYHKTTAKLNLHHTINFGRSWQGQSNCSFGYISLPYLDGPELETLLIDGKCVKFYWLIPITESERNYKERCGIEALENLFDNGFNYIDNSRKSLI
jgi:hypothetical protein